MPVPRRRHSKARRDRARTHKYLKARNIQRCENCGEPKLAHRVCPSCSYYNGRFYKTTVTSG